MVVTTLLLMAVSGALGGVFNTALYRYAADGAVGGPFERSQLEAAFASKEDRKEQSKGRKALRIIWIALIVVTVGLQILRRQFGGP